MNNQYILNHCIIVSDDQIVYYLSFKRIYKNRDSKSKNLLISM